MIDSDVFGQTIPLTESERQEKFDFNFYDKIQTEIALKNTFDTCVNTFDTSITTSEFITTNQNLSSECNAIIPYGNSTLSTLSDELGNYRVIVLLYPDSGSVNSTGSIAEQNKNTLVSNLQENHNATNIFKAETLSFVIADVPVAEISSLADYSNVHIIGDGEAHSNFSLSQSRQHIHADAIDVGSLSGDGIVLSVIDSSLDQQHADLFPSSETVVVDQVLCDNNGCISIAGHPLAQDVIGHGTGTAGVMIGRGTNNAALQGIAHDSQLVSMNVKGDSQSIQNPITSSSVGESLDWLVTNHPEVKAVNISINNCADTGIVSTFSLMADQAIAQSNDLLVVVSSGNNLLSVCTFDILNPFIGQPLASPPATGYNVISVGNWDYNSGNPRIWDKSQHGPVEFKRIKPELVAPGTAITFPAANNNFQDYVTSTGTSLSAPHVTGAIGIIKEAHPNMHPLETKSILLAGANWHGPVQYTANDYDNCVDLTEPDNWSASCPEQVNLWGFGLLDLEKSLNIANQGTFFTKATIPEVGNTSDNYSLPVTQCVPTKVILTWFNVPIGPITDPDSGPLENLTLTILDENDNVVHVSNSMNQNIEFVMFVPSVTDDWKIEVTSEGNFHPSDTNISYAIAYTEFEFSIPEWIKISATEWSSDNINDDKYVNSLGWLVDHHVINIDVSNAGPDQGLSIPSWIKQNAEWWAHDLITDLEYANALTFLIDNGIITLGGSITNNGEILSLTEQSSATTFGDVTIVPAVNTSRGCEPNCFVPNVVTVDPGDTNFFKHQ